MDIKEFFEIYFNHLEKKKDEVMRIVALETNLEKWFQGEMALAFSDSKQDSKLNDNFKIFSSRSYNQESDNLKEDYWNDSVIGERGIVSLEGNIYKSVKTERSGSSGTRKVDLLLENQKEIIFSELKIIWLSYMKNGDQYSYLERKKVLEDAWRLRTNLYREFRKNKTLSLFLTLICIDDCNLNNPDQTKKCILASLNEYFEDNIFEDEEGQILIKKIPYDLRSSTSICLEVYDDNRYDGYLTMINIPLKN